MGWSIEPKNSTASIYPNGKVILTTNTGNDIEYTVKYVDDKGRCGTYTFTQKGSGGGGGCSITEVNEFDANATGDKTIGKLPNGITDKPNNWRFDIDSSVDWLRFLTIATGGDIIGRLNSNDGENTEPRSTTVTATCTNSDECGNCYNKGITFNVRQKGTIVNCNATGEDNIPSEGGKHIKVGTLPYIGNWDFRYDNTYQKGVDFLGDLTADGLNIMANVSKNNGASRKGRYYAANGDCDDTFTVEQYGTSPTPVEGSVRFKFYNDDTEAITIEGYQLYFTPLLEVCDCMQDDPVKPCEWGTHHLGVNDIDPNTGQHTYREAIAPGNNSRTIVHNFSQEEINYLGTSRPYWQNATPSYARPGCELKEDNKAIKLYSNGNSDTIFGKFLSGLVDSNTVYIIKVKKGKILIPGTSYYEDPWGNQNPSVNCTK